MGSGSAIRQWDERFNQGEHGWTGEKQEECSFDEMPQMVKAFGGWEVWKDEKGDYTLVRRGEVVGIFHEAIVEEDRVLFLLNKGMELEVSEKGVREIMTPEKAELCGMIGADGGCRKQHRYNEERGHWYAYIIAYYSEDEELIEKYDELFKQVYNRTPHHYRSHGDLIQSGIFQRDIYYDLEQYDIKPAPYEFHVPFKYLDEEGLRAYVRGFFSGDGTVGYDRNEGNW